MSSKECTVSFCSTDNCPCEERCPLLLALEIIGGKWKIPIICALHSDGVTRYNELRRKINNISNTMVASSLKELESDGIVLRTQYNEMPLRVEYELSNKSASIIPILQKLMIWGSEWNASKDL